MIKKVTERLLQVCLVFLMLVTVFPQSLITAIHADAETLDPNKMLLATVQRDKGDIKYYYAEQLKSDYSSCNRVWDDDQKYGCIIAYAWSDSVKNSESGQYHETMTLYYDWLASSYDGGHIMQAPDQGNNYYGSAYYYGAANADGDITLDLNGHLVDRRHSNSSHETSGNTEVFRIPSGRKLTIEDSDQTKMNMGYASDRIWYSTTDPTKNTEPIYGGVITGGSNDTGAGGIVVCGNATLVINAGTIAGNTSWKGGGGVSATDSGAVIIMNGGAISYNLAFRAHGGGVFLGGHSAASGDGTMLMTGGEISHNYAYNSYTGIGGCGGGIYINSTEDNTSFEDGYSATMMMTGGLIAYNGAEDNGGGIFQDYGNVLLRGGTILNNNTEGCGGGVYANGYNYSAASREVRIMGVAIMNNYARKDGGGFYVNTGHAELNSGTITGNIAGNDTSKNSDSGSGVFIKKGYNYLALTGGTVYCQNNQYHNLFLQTNDDIDTGSLSADSVVYVSSADWSDGKTSVKLTDNGYCARIPRSTLRSDYDGYYITMNNKGNHYLTQGTDPDTGSSVGPETEIISETVNGAETDVKYKKVPFKYTSVLDSKDLESSIYYNDNLFSQSADVYNQHLASASMGLAMSAFRRPSYTDEAEQAKNVTDLYSSLGFGNTVVHYPTPAKTADGYTIGYSISLKRAMINKKFTYIIAVAVRGANYTTEWGSNTTLNDSANDNGEATGFSNAADQVMEGVEDYIAHLSSSERTYFEKYKHVKFWITGYSRGGATANLTARRIIDGISYADSSNVYAYTFEAPQGGVSTTQTTSLNHTTWDSNYPKSAPASYTSIHNIINKLDLVPTVAPSVMGFTRYGVDHNIPGNTALSDNSSDYYASDSDAYYNLRNSMRSS